MLKKSFISFSADDLSVGHIQIIKYAKEISDSLVIGLLTDSAISSRKAFPNKTFSERFEIVSSISGVDKVIPQNSWDCSEIIVELKPNFFISGDDWKFGPESFFREKAIAAIKKIGGEYIELPYWQQKSESKRVKKGYPNLKASRLSQLLDYRKELIRVIEVHSPISAIIAENTVHNSNKNIKRFDAFWLSSLTTSSMLGKPDIEIVDLATRLQIVQNILNVTNLPIIYDGDTGGHLRHIASNTLALEKVGISAVVYEDKTGFKQNSLIDNELTNQKQAEINEFCEKIQEASKGIVSSDFILFARIESLILGKPVSDALKRALSYLEAGADGIVIHSKEKDGSDIIEFSKEFKKSCANVPLFIIPTTYPHIKASVYQKLDINGVIYANHLLRASVHSMEKVAKSILKNDRTLEVERLITDVKDLIARVPENY